MILIHKVLHKALHKVLQKNQKFIMSKRKPKQMAMTQKSTQSTQDSCYSWSSVSQEIDIKGEKRELHNDEEDLGGNPLNLSQIKNEHKKLN